MTARREQTEQTLSDESSVNVRQRYGRHLPTESRFLPTEPSPSYSAVKIYDATGKLIRTIPRATLQARGLAEEKHAAKHTASITPRGIEFPTAGKIKAKGRRY